MKSILVAFVLVSAGAASVAGVSFGVPDDLASGLPRLGAGAGEDAVRRADEIPSTLTKQPRLETAQAQTVDTARQQTPAESKPAVDESALRYFAARGDTARLNAEIARLRALYPTWIPPENPLAVPVNEDRQLEEMWALYAQSRYADVRAAIAKRQQDDPQWTPPADLVDRLDVAEKRAELVAASNAGRSEDVVRLGAETPSLLTCSDADVLWRVAEAFVKTGKELGVI